MMPSKKPAISRMVAEELLSLSERIDEIEDRFSPRLGDGQRLVKARDLEGWQDRQSERISQALADILVKRDDHDKELWRKLEKRIDALKKLPIGGLVTDLESVKAQISGVSKAISAFQRRARRTEAQNKALDALRVRVSALEQPQEPTAKVGRLRAGLKALKIIS